MKRLTMLAVLVLGALVLFSGPLGGTVHTAQAQTSYVCLPTCSTTDARFFVMAGSGLATLAGQTSDVELAAPASAASVELGIFDGDAGAADETGAVHWDYSSLPTTYTIYADPQADGSGSILVAEYSSSAMPDNAWFSVTIPTDEQAQSPSGNYFFRLHIGLVNVGLVADNEFKLRSDGFLSVRAGEPIAFQAAQFSSLADVQTVYPSYPDSAVPTTYDGSYTFHIDVPSTQSQLVMWDGDLDRGDYYGTNADTDDPDTPDDVIPPWTTSSAHFEGVAVGYGVSTGYPPDDSRLAGAGKWLLRTPSVRYDVIFPDGRTFANDNPSGNLEWEQFRITAIPGDPIPADYSTGPITPGTYQVNLQGMDMQNLNAWVFMNTVLCVDENGVACVPLRAYRIGDYVWYDANGNGLQDDGATAGIGGVVVNLYNDVGTFVASTTTNPDGSYYFDVDPGYYTVQIAPESLGFGGALSGLSPTVDYTGDGNGDNRRTQQVVNQNVLTYDFGYVAGLTGSSGALGDTVWNDANDNGLQDAGELGIDGVSVNLSGDIDGDGIDELFATTTTQTVGPDTGIYAFTNLPAGTYTVTIAASNFASGGPLDGWYASPAFQGTDAAVDSNGDVTTHDASVALASGDTDITIDFGFYLPPNMCAFIRSPGYWKNYSQHMSTATFESILNSTVDYQGMTAAQAVVILGNNNESYAKFLLASELNAAWNGDDNNPGVGGDMGLGIYHDSGSSLDGLTVNQALHQCYVDRATPSQDETDAVTYLGKTGEGESQGACLVQYQ